MNLIEAVESLIDAFPSAKTTDNTIARYVADLEDMPEELVVAAINRLRLTEDWMPPVAKIRELVAEAILGLPSEEEAWSSVRKAFGSGDWDSVHPTALSSARDVGTWELRNDEKGYAKRDFMTAYTKARTSQVKALQSGVEGGTNNALGEGR